MNLQYSDNYSTATNHEMFLSRQCYNTQFLKVNNRIFEFGLSNLGYSLHLMKLPMLNFLHVFLCLFSKIHYVCNPNKTGMISCCFSFLNINFDTVTAHTFSVFMWQTFDRNSFINVTILYSFEKMEFLIPVIPLDKGSVLLKTPFLSTTINRNNNKKNFIPHVIQHVPPPNLNYSEILLCTFHYCCNLQYNVHVHIIHVTIPGPRVVTDAEFHIATEPNGCIEFHSIFLPKYRKKFTFKNLIRFVSL